MNECGLQSSNSCSRVAYRPALLHLLDSIQRAFVSARDIPDAGTQQERDPSRELEAAIG